MKIKEWPDNERPREKLLHNGANTLSDAELLALFLRVGTREKNAVELARDLLKHSGGLRALLDMSVSDMQKHKGLGLAGIAMIKAIMELGHRYLRASVDRGDVMDCPDTTRQYINMQLRGHQHEVFACLFLDNQHRIIRFEKMFNGTINSANVHAREIVKRALQLNAAAVIFAHNHPSGTAEPSRADETLTNHLTGALKIIDVRVLDHIIIGDHECSSFAEQGLI